MVPFSYLVQGFCFLFWFFLEYDTDFFCLDDGAIRYMTVNMYFDVEKEVERFCGIEYYYRGYQGSECECLA